MSGVYIHTSVFIVCSIIHIAVLASLVLLQNCLVRKKYQQRIFSDVERCDTLLTFSDVMGFCWLTEMLKDTLSNFESASIRLFRFYSSI